MKLPGYFQQATPQHTLPSDELLGNRQGDRDRPVGFTGGGRGDGGRRDPLDSAFLDAGMLLNPPSRRGSYSIPIHINLQSARRRQGREIMSSMSAKEARNKGERAKTQITSVSSVGEDRAILLGLSMVGFAVLMYFLFGFMLVNPYLRSNWSEETNCTLIQSTLLEQADIPSQYNYPCLQVSVNLSSARQTAELYYNEDMIQLNPKCFYNPKDHQNKADLLQEAQRIQKYLENISNSFACYSNPDEYPGEAILSRRYNGWLVLWYMSWPSLMLAGGLMTISLVRLTQRLSQMCVQLGAQR